MKTETPGYERAYRDGNLIDAEILAMIRLLELRGRPATPAKMGEWERCQRIIADARASRNRGFALPCPDCGIALIRVDLGADEEWLCPDCTRFELPEENAA